MGNNLSLGRQRRFSNIELPGDLVEEIFCNLPVKSLLRFKTVCKSWNKLFDSHAFIYKHLHRRYPQLGGYSVHLHRDILPSRINRIVGACNDIICLSCSTKKTLVLFNPSTREFSYVPPQVCVVSAYSGFCYLPRTQEYQKKNLGKRVVDNVIDITTLTLGKITSSSEAKNIEIPGRISNARTTSSKTCMYWLGLDFDTENEIVIWYDVIEGRFSKMNTPPSPTYLTRTLRVFKGSVIMFLSPTDAFTFVDIWMIIDDVSSRKSWMKYRTVGPLETSVYPIEVCWYYRWILCTDGIPNGYIMSSNLFYYDLEADQVEDYSDFHAARNNESKNLFRVHFTNYVESLVSVKRLVPDVDTDCYFHVILFILVSLSIVTFLN